MDGINPRALELLNALQGDFGELNVISGYRDPERNARVGGAKSSQHLHGNAFDIDVANLPQDVRLAMIRRARELGFGGVGVYDNSLHFDIGPERAWGPSHSRDSLPEWAMGALVPQGAPQPAENALATPQPEPRREMNALRFATLDPADFMIEQRWG